MYTVLFLAWVILAVCFLVLGIIKVYQKCYSPTKQCNNDDEVLSRSELRSLLMSALQSANTEEAFDFLEHASKRFPDINRAVCNKYEEWEASQQG